MWHSRSWQELPSMLYKLQGQEHEQEQQARTRTKLSSTSRLPSPLSTGWLHVEDVAPAADVAAAPAAAVRLRMPFVYLSWHVALLPVTWRLSESFRIYVAAGSGICILISLANLGATRGRHRLILRRRLVNCANLMALAGAATPAL